MAQRDTRKESTSTKERPSSLQTSLSQPTPVNSTNQQNSNSRRHLTLPGPSNNNYPVSRAEEYIISRSQMLLKPNEKKDLSPESPLSIASSTTGTNISSIQSPMSHAERMHNWHQEQATKICKKQKHSYTYGPPSPSPFGTSNSLGNPFSSQQSNVSVPSQRNNISSTRTVKK